MYGEERSKARERRSFERFDMKFSAKVTHLAFDREISVRTRDISPQGVCLLAKERLEEHTLLKVRLSIPDKKGPLFTYGKAVWARQELEGWKIGIRFEKPEIVSLSRILRMKRFKLQAADNSN